MNTNWDKYLQILWALPSGRPFIILISLFVWSDCPWMSTVFFLCIKSTSLKIRGRYILMANCCSGVSVRVTPSQILHCVWSVTRFTDRVLCPSCQATCHYSAALALISSLPSLKENYHSSQSPPLCLPLCAPLHIIRCSHACAWQPCFPVPADCCTITHWKLAGQERSAANYAPVIPSQRSHFFSFLSFQC